MLGLRKVATRLPAKDLDRARAWYAEKLGLEPVEERPGGLRYIVGSKRIGPRKPQRRRGPLQLLVNFKKHLPSLSVQEAPAQDE